MRAALMEQAAHEAAAAAAGIFRDNVTSPPSASNGHPVRDSLSNGRSPAASLDHHLLQMSDRFDRDRVYSSLEKELLSRNPANHQNKMIISPPSYPDAIRSYSEEMTREAEEEWRNIHTVSRKF
jgi:hypothetical protein